MAATLYGVSVGPGDPELLTLKAKRIIETCAVIAAPRTHGSNCLALEIVSQVVELRDKTILYLDQLMKPDREAMQQRYAENASVLKEVLNTGADVALLTLGDVSIYSTCSYLMAQLADAGYKCETVPGVPSFCACAAVLNQSLAEWDQPLHIFPGSCQDMDAAFALPGGKVLMKPASALPGLRDKIRELELGGKTHIVTDCGLPTQAVYTVDDEHISSYFTTILIQP